VPLVLDTRLQLGEGRQAVGKFHIALLVYEWSIRKL
jgi:hypothetical protein